jgi:hypothetical protein
MVNLVSLGWVFLLLCISARGARFGEPDGATPAHVNNPGKSTSTGGQERNISAIREFYIKNDTFMLVRRRSCS